MEQQRYRNDMESNNANGSTGYLTQPTVIRGSDRPLFGFHHLPAAPVKDRAVLLCPPLGYESLVTYRTYRHLAEQLARQGFHVLRFDYFGTGNSSGLARDAHDLTGDVHAALDHLKQLSGIAQLCVLGVRAGALLAAAAATQRTDVTALMLLAAPASGRMLVRELKAFQTMTAVQEPGEDHGSNDPDRLHLVGFELSAAVQAELIQINLLKTSFANLKHVLILGRDDLADDGKLLHHCTEAGCQVRQVAVKGYAEMMTTTEASVLPVRLMEHVAAWLNEFAQPVAHEVVRNELPALLLQQGQVALREQAGWFGPAQRLFGVVTQPELTPANGPRTAVLLMSVGANHHVGSGRIYVEVARELAAENTVVLRFDVSGIGESRAEPGKEENVIYDPDSIEDVSHAIDMLEREHGITQFILAGVCLGAHLAFHALPSDRRIIGRILFNWAVFELQPPVHAHVQQRKSFKSRSDYTHAIFDLATWRRLLRGEVAGFAIAGHLLRQLRQNLSATLKRKLMFWRNAETGSNPVEARMKTILRTGTPTWLIYSAGDPALDGMQPFLGRDAAWVRGPACFDMRVVAGADHAFSRPVSQQALHALMREFVLVARARSNHATHKAS